jgi:hypothetical protein
MFLEHRFGTTKETKDEIRELAYVGFTLTTKFKQNICLLKDGTIVFCNRFLPTTAITESSTDNGEVEGDGKPLIAGFKFGSVC